MNKTEWFYGKITEAIPTAMVVAVTLALSLVFWLKAAGYPANSELAFDYMTAGTTFMFVYLYAIHRLFRDFDGAIIAMIGLPFIGIMSAAGCSAVCYTTASNALVIPSEVFAAPLAATLAFVIVMMVFQFIGKKMDRWEEEHLQQKHKRKNEELIAAESRLTAPLEIDMNLIFESMNEHMSIWGGR